MLIGLNSAISMFAGSFLAWGLIGPLLVHYGECIGKPGGGDDPKWAPLMSFTSLSNIGIVTPSPNTGCSGRKSILLITSSMLTWS